MYTGCAGNGNNFASKIECVTVCSNHTGTNNSQSNRRPGGIEFVTAFPRVKSDCSKPIIKGQCSRTIQMFGFDRLTRKCRNFTYTGCGGNSNRFFSLAECKDTCETNAISKSTTQKPFRSWQRYMCSNVLLFCYNICYNI